MASGFIAQKPTYSYIKHFYGFSSRDSLARTRQVEKPQDPLTAVGALGQSGDPWGPPGTGSGRAAQVRRGAGKWEADPPGKTYGFPNLQLFFRDMV